MKSSRQSIGLVNVSGPGPLLILGLALWVVGTLCPHRAAAWQQQINGTEDSVDRARAIAVDSSGDVIAAGSLDNSGSSADFTVIKFAGTTGAELWRQEIDGTASWWYDEVRSVTVDLSGDVVAAGQLNNSGTSRDFAVIKFSGVTGAELWRQEINGTVGDSDSVRAVTVNNSGDVIAAGSLDNSGSSADFTVIKFAGTTGAELWRQEIDGTASWWYDEVRSVTVDLSGDVVAAGQLNNSGTYTDFTVVKISGATGAELWRQEISGTGSPSSESYDLAKAVTVDTSGDVVAMGYLYNSGNHHDLTVIKFGGATGAELWRQEISGRASTYAWPWNFAGSVTVDPSGDVVAAGYLNNFRNHHDFTVIKFAQTTGAELWRREVAGSDGVNWWASAYSVTVDASGDVIAGGIHRNAFTVIKLAGATGAQLWGQEVAARESSSLDIAHSVTVDASGDVIAAGWIDNSATNDDFTVIKFKGQDGTAGPVQGRRLVVRDNAEDPGDRRIVFRAIDKTVVTPVPGGPDDPTVAGAKLLLLNPTTSESASFVLPGGWGVWKGLGNPPGSKGYRYRDSDGTNGPCKVLVAKPHKRLKAVCLGKLGTIPFTLDEAAQGSLTVSVQLGNADPQCMTFGGTVTKDAGTSNPGPRGIFSAKDALPPSGSCPAP